MESTLDPKDWGWRLGASLVPVMTDELLKVTRCNCQVPSTNLCSGKQYSCCSNRLKCVAGCGGCWGT